MTRGQRSDDRFAPPPWLRSGSDFVTVEVAARPGAPRRGIFRTNDRCLVVGVNAPAEKGKANQELIEFFATAARVPRAAVKIVRGEGSRHKVVRIGTSDPGTVAERLLQAAFLAGRHGSGE